MQRLLLLASSRTVVN